MTLAVSKRKAIVYENCLRTGHTQKFCVLKPKCAKCGSKEHASTACKVKTVSKCFICDLEHDPNDRSLCPRITDANRRHQEQLKKRTKNAYAEALKGIIPTSNSYDSLSSDDDMEVDSLQTSTRPQVPTAKKRKTAQGNPTLSKASPIPSTSKVGEISSSSTHQKLSKPSFTNRCGFPKASSTQEQTPILTHSSTNAFYSLLCNFVNLLPIDIQWKQLLKTLIDFCFTNVYPLVTPLLNTLLHQNQ